eukprot:3971936-Pyramimonas_sp.AAC.1
MPLPRRRHGQLQLALHDTGAGDQNTPETKTEVTGRGRRSYASRQNTTDEHGHRRGREHRRVQGERSRR